MEKYPYQASIVQKEAVKPQMPKRTPRYPFLAELKDSLEAHQALQLIVPVKETASITAAWRSLCKGLEPHTFSRRRDENSSTVYLWLGPLLG